MDVDRAFHFQNSTVEVCLSTYASQTRALPGSTPLFRRVNRLIIHFKNRTYTWLLNKFVKLGKKKSRPFSHV